MLSRSSSGYSISYQPLAQLLTAVVALATLSCGEAYFHRLSESPLTDGGNSDNSSSPGTPNNSTEQELDPWQWAQPQRVIVAPWAHVLSDEEIERMEIKTSQDMMDALLTASESALTSTAHTISMPIVDGMNPNQYRVNDLIWSSSPDLERNFIRRINSIEVMEEEVLLSTSEAQLDELFLKVILSESIIDAFDYAPDNIDKGHLEICRHGEDGPLIPCASSTNGEPILEWTFEKSASLDVQEARLSLEIDFFERIDRKCACLTQHYHSESSILKEQCSISLVDNSVLRAVDEAKKECRGNVKKFSLQVFGDFALQVADLEILASETLSYETIHPLVLHRAVHTIPVSQGYISLEFSVRAALAAKTTEAYSQRWQAPNNLVAANVLTGVAIEWPYAAPHDKRAKVELYAPETHNSQVDAGDEISVEFSDNSEVQTRYELFMNSSFLGVLGPSATLLGVSIHGESEIDLRQEFSGGSQDESFTKFCEHELSIGTYSEVFLASRMPFAGFASTATEYRVLDTCHEAHRPAWSHLCRKYNVSECLD